MPHSTESQIIVRKIEPQQGSSFDFGAEIQGADLENISSKTRNRTMEDIC